MNQQQFPRINSMEKNVQQHTINNPIEIQGIGLHSGVNVNMRLLPAAVDQGIIFRRTDLSQVHDIKITPFNITEAVMCTLLVCPEDKTITVSTIEHLMSALCMFQVDNVLFGCTRLHMNHRFLLLLVGEDGYFIFDADITHG